MALVNSNIMRNLPMVSTLFLLLTIISPITSFDYQPAGGCKHQPFLFDINVYMFKLKPHLIWFMLHV
jgi:hypothetical protein